MLITAINVGPCKPKAKPAIFYCCVGAHVSASHLLPVREGLVIATTKPLHLGGRTQLWEVKITREDGRLFCDARMSLQVIKAIV